MDSKLKRALPIVASAYGEQFGVRVTVGGTGAFTDGSRINIPWVEDASMQALVWGYLAHESGHVRDTDFTVFNSLDNPVRRHLVNTLEDPRIEKSIMGEFPGTEASLRAVWAYLCKDSISVDPELNDTARLLNFALMYVRQRQWGLEVSKPHFEAALAQAEEVLPAGFFVRFDALIAQYFDAMRCTADAVSLADAILTVLQEEIEKEEQENACDASESSNKSASDSDDDSGEDGASNGDSGNSDQDSLGGASGSGEGEADNPGQNDAAPSDSDEDGETADQGASDSTSDASDSSDGNSDADGNDTQQQGGGGASEHSKFDQMMAESDVPADVIEQLTEALSEHAEQEVHASDGNDRPYGTVETDVGEQIDSSQHAGLMDEQCGDAISEGVLSSSKLRAQITGLLQAQTRSIRSVREEGTRIESRRLARAMAGERKIYKHKESGKRIDTSVHVLLDCSGSMYRIQPIANSAAVSLALAVNAIPNADIAVSAFGLYDAVNPIIRRKQPVRSNLDRFKVGAHGGTPMGEAMLYGARELAMNSNRARKVLIVVTDGAPNNGDLVSYVTRLCGDSDIDVYGIGIQSDAVSRFFRNNVVISSVNDLQGALFNIAREFLRVA